MITDPQGLSFLEWADDVSFDLADYGPAPRPESEEKWKEWAERVLELPGIAAMVPPQPYGFTDWREWATRFVAILEVEG